MPHYNFIEIGTCNFDTIIERATAAEVGLSVEPLKFYLDALPNKPNVRKINAAISNKNGTTTCFFVPEEKISMLQLPDWVKGCNSIINPHPTVLNILRSRHIDVSSCILSEEIVVKDIPTLFTENDVTGIDYLKLDTEGHDCVILQNYIEHCDKNPSHFATKIMFETNILSAKEAQDNIIKQLTDRGYKIIIRNSTDTVLVK